MNFQHSFYHKLLQISPDYFLSQHISSFWLITGTAFILRFGLLWILTLSPALEAKTRLSLDAASYHQIAVNLVEHHIFTSPVDPPYDPNLPATFRPPLTPFFLAGIYLVFGIDLFWGRLGLAILSALSCGLLYLFVQKLIGHTTGLVAGFLCCIYPFFLLLVLIPLTEGFSMFLSLFLLFLLYRFPLSSQPSKINGSIQLHLGWLTGVGVVFGVALLNKASNIVLLPCIILWSMSFLAGSWILRCIRVLIILLITTMVIFPWAMRNQRITGTFTPINSNGGWTFYLGNNTYTEKNVSALENETTNGWIPPKEVFLPFRDLSFQDTKNYEKRAIRLGITFIREHPEQFLNLAWRKLKIFWSPYSHVLDQVSWYPLLILSLIGLLYSFKDWQKYMLIYVFILSSMSIPVVFTSMPRFRAPIMPFLMLYGAFGLIKLGHLMGFKIHA